MADSYVRVPADSAGKKVDATSLDVGADTVYRQRIVIADNSATAQYATVTGGALTITGNVNISATATVVLGAGVANIGVLNSISRTVNVAISTPFTLDNISATVNVTIATPFTLNNISATVNVAVLEALNLSAIPGVVVDGTSYTTQAAVFRPIGGLFNDATPNTLSEGDAGILRVTSYRGVHANLRTDGGVKMDDSTNAALRVNIVAGGGSGGTSQVDGTSFNAQVSNFTPIGGIYDNTSPDTLSENDAGVVRMTSNRAFHVCLQTASGSAINASSPLSVNVENLTATASVVIAPGTANIGRTPAVPGATQGPKCVIASTSAAVALIAAPASGSIYITQLMVGNYGSTLTRARIGTSASSQYVVQPLAANGGGFVLNFDPPFMLSAQSTAICSVKPNVSEVYFTVNFYVA